MLFRDGFPSDWADVLAPLCVVVLALLSIALINRWRSIRYYQLARANQTQTLLNEQVSAVSAFACAAQT